MSQQTNDKNLNLAATPVTVRGRAKLTGALAFGAALTLALFSGRAEAGLTAQNGLSSQNGMKIHNGLTSQNGMKVHNGLTSQNGMKVHNGLTAQNGMKVHNGVRASGTWFMRTVDPARPLSAAVKARR
jgi:hypothetical protein